MENSKSILIDDESIIYYPSTPLNFGVHSKKTVKSQRNLFMSFTPISSNKEISFSNTIMCPIITTEATVDTEKNNSHLENEKSKQLMKKDSTGIKTESSREEKNNSSYEKKVSNILIENNDNSKKEEDIYVLGENQEQKEALEVNPFFFGGKVSEINNWLKNENAEIEKKNVNKILNHENKILINDDLIYCKTSKHLNNKIDNEAAKIRLARRAKRMKTINASLEKKIDNTKKDCPKKILKKVKPNQKCLFKSEIKITKNYNQSEKTKKTENENSNLKNGKVQRSNKRELTVINQAPLFKFKDNNFKLYRANLYNIHHSMSNKKSVVIKENSEIEKIHKEKKKKLKYIGVSEHKLNTKLCIDTPKNKKDNNFQEKLKLIQIMKQNKEDKENLNLRKRKLSASFHAKFNKLKAFKAEMNIIENKNTFTAFKKRGSEIRNSFNFESALKNKKNLANTQFNLFSPDKFTNTTFCDSDYCEYTLDCMDLILNKNKSQRQIKNKINLNFPKPQKNKIKKKIALFDLDETLVHCTGDINLKKEAYQHSIDIALPGSKEVTVGINIRPCWKKTLNLIKRHYHIVVFTASHQAYADAVLDFMDPSKKYFKYRLYRNNCSLVNVDGAQFYVKDLDIFDENYDLKDIVIIDNSVLSFIYHLENGIPIVPYYNEDKDGSLYVVGLYLMHIYKENDLREANKKYINLESFLKTAKERKDENSTINEESISEENNNGNNNTILNDANSNIKINPQLKLDINANISENAEKASKISLSHRRNSACYSFATDRSQQSKLISQSKLINMYYSINDNCLSNRSKKEILEMDKRSNKNSSSEEEKEMNENKSNKDESESFFKNKLLSLEDSPINLHVKRYSNNSCCNYLDLKLVRHNFYDNFSTKQNK